MGSPHQRVVLVQLPIPPAGSQPVRGNIPLAPACLKLLARRRGLESAWAIELMPADVTNRAGDLGLVQAILACRPSLVGFTCTLWNVERTLWVARRVKDLDPEVQIVLGGPEITADNAAVLQHPAVDFAAIGEGEQTFAELLAALADQQPVPPGVQPVPPGEFAIPGLWVRQSGVLPAPRAPLADLDEISSPYLEGILDAADERTMFLETVRGCAFRCKFCYYPKGYEERHFVSPERIAANLRHAVRRGARDVVLLDPTLNHRGDFADLLRLLARGNPDRQLAYFGELRAERLDPEHARLLAEANFTEVEVGLQSLDPRVQELIGRRLDREALERGVQALLDVGIEVRLDLILGLPGETVDSFRRTLDQVRGSSLRGCTVQVFNLSILPGTALRREAGSLGLSYQARPPYYVLGTPTLDGGQMLALMEEAEEAFGLEYDLFGPPALGPGVAGDSGDSGHSPIEIIELDLDRPPWSLPPAEKRALALTLRLRSDDFDARRHSAAKLVGRLLDDNPHTTLQVVLEPAGDPRHLTLRALQTLQAACYRSASFLDLFYSLHPNRLLSAKRLLVLLAEEHRAGLGRPWVDAVGQYAGILWR